MALRTRNNPVSRRSRPPARRGHDGPRGPAEPPEERARRAGGPEDHALYRCTCGQWFQADVSASVRCPHCGGEQAW